MNTVCKIVCIGAFAIGLFFGESGAVARPPKGDAPKAEAGKAGKNGHDGARQKKRAKSRRHARHHHRHHHRKHGQQGGKAPSNRAN